MPYLISEDAKRAVTIETLHKLLLRESKLLEKSFTSFERLATCTFEESGVPNEVGRSESLENVL